MAAWVAPAIAAGATILSSVMGSKADREAQERKAKIDAAQRGGEMQMEAHGQQGAAQGNSFAQLMNAYRDALVR